ncbi:sensor histidine kinase [Aeromicrobium endophyticum]|uniref:histidine kinase n=1 Tax=Aeromicrobium endophyticum TaxID=2292704 RepID=A0A371PDW9_9ACTN|nr:HAMP domain-containing sensor histidine kinase [Aeromicrobium endophyticum]REK73708.1 sensor histidine kinase [Aeromicrobium endophyticum]
MRERLVVTLMSVTVGILVVFGVVRAYSTADLVREQQRGSVAQSADASAVAIGARQDGPEPVSGAFLAALAGDDRRVTFVDADGRRTSGGAASVTGTEDGDLRASRSVQGGGRVTVAEAASVQSDRVSGALLPLVLLALALAVVAAVIGSLLARRLAHPFRRLADDATRIGDGHFDVEVHHSSIKEAEELGNALRRAASQLGSLVERERELAVVASHELRTPITALRLSLEDLTLWPQTPPDVAAELQHSLTEVDRLSGVISSLLEQGARGHLGNVTQTDVGELVGDAASRWSDRGAALGRSVVAGGSDAIALPLHRASVDQILDVLVERALQHGEGTVTIDAARFSTHARIRVADESDRTLATGIVRADAGQQLTSAANQAESIGGFVGVEDIAHTVLVLALPWPRRRVES